MLYLLKNNISQPVELFRSGEESKLDANYTTSTIIEAGYTDISSIENWASYGKKTNKDYEVHSREIANIVTTTTFALLTDAEKDIACKYASILTGSVPDHNTMITYYASTPSYGMLGDVEAASNFHYHRFGEHLNNLRDAAAIRVNAPRISIAMMKYFKDIDTINTFYDAIRAFRLDYVGKFHLGTAYGDTIDGIMDYLESTGTYIGAGLMTYQFSDTYIQAWLDANAVDPLIPTQVELDAADDYVRALLITEFKETLVYGNF